MKAVVTGLSMVVDLLPSFFFYLCLQFPQDKCAMATILGWHTAAKEIIREYSTIMLIPYYLFILPHRNCIVVLWMGSMSSFDAISFLFLIYAAICASSCCNFSCMQFDIIWFWSCSSILFKMEKTKNKIKLIGQSPHVAVLCLIIL